jgi:SSS family solute:Na+ symporter/sodium/pantothenate symporter
LALTVAATAISGGTFMGFPSLIYSNGWIMALWICSYMVVPLTTMALMGKRINQVARLAGSVTVPDVLRDRFQSPTLGIFSTLLILGFLIFNLVGQFKAGGLVMREALRLRPVQARYVDHRVDEHKTLHVQFELPDGSREVQKTPLPHVDARVTNVVTDADKREAVVSFQLPGDKVQKRIPFPAEKVFFLMWIDKGYLLGLFIFALTVVGYTTFGGFWAVTWTDVLEGLVMLVGVILLAVLAVGAVEPYKGHTGLAAATEKLHDLQQAGTPAESLVYGPGPPNARGEPFLPLGMAFSFFLMWSLMAAGQPSGMVRQMSFKDSPSLRRALMLVCGYYLVTYVSLLIIFVCARAIFPTEYLRDMGSEGQPDSIMPAMVRHVSHPLVAGLLLAAPYAAIMSTVAAFLLMISSSLVRDIYQRTVNPQASPRTLKFLSYLITALVGAIAILGALNPPDYLQDIIVFTGAGQGCAFLVPMLMALYWRRATRPGVIASMLGGVLGLLAFYAASWVQQAGFRPMIVGGVDPLVWGLLASLVLGIAVSLCTRPDERLVNKYFP